MLKYIGFGTAGGRRRRLCRCHDNLLKIPNAGLVVVVSTHADHSGPYCPNVLSSCMA